MSGVRTVDAYRAIRERVVPLLASIQPPPDDRRVPACPRWNVRDLAAHLAGVADDALAGRMDGAPSDEWTGAQVAARQDRTLAEVLQEWNELGPVLEERLGDHLPAQMVFDTVTHEHDLRAATGRPGQRDSDAVMIAVGFALRSFEQGSIIPAALPALRVVAGDRDQVLGEGRPAATLTVTPFDLIRSLSGRRTPAQIAALDWDTDPGPWMGAFAFGPFTLPDQPVD